MGFFKPLQPWGNSLILEQTIRLFQKAGISDIRVVVGYKADLLIPILKRLGVKTIFNSDYDRGMYSSVQVAVRTLESGKQAFFLLPGDSPLVKESTISQLLVAYQSLGDIDVLYPVFGGRKGHPPLILKTCFEAIMNSEPREGLKEVLRNHAHRQRYINVEDPGILLDFDTWEDYQKGVKATFGKEPLFPSKEKCMVLLTEKQGANKVMTHCREVARVASCLAEHLNSGGSRLNLGLVMAGGLLHDLAKGEKNHARRGGQIMRDLGYGDVARIIEGHMRISFGDLVLDETAIIYYADKIVQEDYLVSLDERFAYARDKYWNLPLGEIENRFTQARLIEREIESVLEKRVEAIF